MLRRFPFRLMDLIHYFDIVLADARPTHIIIHTIIFAFLFISISEIYISTVHSIRIQGYRKFFITKFKCFPFVKYFISVAKAKTIQKIQDDFQMKKRRKKKKLKRLPRSGLTRSEIMEQAQVRRSWDTYGKLETQKCLVQSTCQIAKISKFATVYTPFLPTPIHYTEIPSLLFVAWKQKLLL